MMNKQEAWCLVVFLNLLSFQQGCGHENVALTSTQTERESLELSHGHGLREESFLSLGKKDAGSHQHDVTKYNRFGRRRLRGNMRILKNEKNNKNDKKDKDQQGGMNKEGGKDKMDKQEGSKNDKDGDKQHSNKDKHEGGENYKDDKQQGGKENKDDKPQGGKDKNEKPQGEKDKQDKPQGGNDKQNNKDKDKDHKDDTKDKGKDKNKNDKKEDEYGFGSTSPIINTGCINLGESCNFFACCDEGVCSRTNAGRICTEKITSWTAPEELPSSNEGVAMIYPENRPSPILTKQPPTQSPVSSTVPAQPPVFSSLPAGSCRRLNRDTTMYWCPVERYCLWSFYHAIDTDVTSHLTNIGYTDMEWNYLLHGDVDKTSFSDHLDSVQEGLTRLGYDEETHDCCQSHYQEYWWHNFFEYDGFDTTIHALELLGYNETAWNEGVVVEYYNFWWHELPLKVQDALYEGFCYTEELWNEFPMPVWDLNITLPASYLYSELD